MDYLILSAVMFCSGLSNMKERQLCTYDAIACLAAHEREWQEVKSKPELHFYLKIENSQRLQGAANCFLIRVDLNQIKKDSKEFRK